MQRLLGLAASYTWLQGISGLSIVDRVLYGAWDGKGGDKLTLFANILSIFASFFLLYSSRGLRLMRPVHYLPFLIVALLLVSAVWSMDSAETVRRAVNYAVLVVSALGLAHSMTPMRIMKITVWICAIAAVASLAISMTPYGVGQNTDTGSPDFIGIFPVKNTLGEAMAAGVLGALYCFIAEPRGRKKYAMLLMLFLGVIVDAKCATSLLVSLSYILVVLMMTLHSRGGNARFVVYGLLGGILMLGCIIVAVPEVLFLALGKDATLTGRTDLWPYVIPPILAKPVLGWGFTGFWMFSNPAAMEISGALGWFVPEAHNGLLELLLELGVIGTGLFVTQIVHTIQLGVRCGRLGNPHLGRITVAFIIGLLFMSVSEAILLTPNQIPTLQFFLYGFMCAVSMATTRGQQLAARTDVLNLRLERARRHAAV